VKALQSGEVLDFYRIGELAAHGGMASVYKATDLRTGAHVAVKVPDPEAEMDVVFFDRFAREAEIGRELDHPGIVKVYPRDGQSKVYMAMEWVEGRSLRHILHDEGRLAPEHAVRIALSICEALEYIHAHGIVHRDLKPENVIVDHEDQIKLIDFGIAGKAGARRLTFGKLSPTLGTVDYISPEQVKGKRGDARSDIYALGAMLYEMVSGEVPFTATNPFAAMNARLVSDAVPVRELNRAVSVELDSVIRRAMARDPGQRHTSAGELSFDLTHPGLMKMPEVPRQSQPRSKKLLLYSALAAIPGSILGLMLYVAGHQ
jgi:serine/threonine protein kinase